MGLVVIITVVWGGGGVLNANYFHAIRMCTVVHTVTAIGNISAYRM